MLRAFNRRPRVDQLHRNQPPRLNLQLGARPLEACSPSSSLLEKEARWRPFLFILAVRSTSSRPRPSNVELTFTNSSLLEAKHTHTHQFLGQVDSWWVELSAKRSAPSAFPTLRRNRSWAKSWERFGSLEASKSHPSRSARSAIQMSPSWRPQMRIRNKPPPNEKHENLHTAWTESPAKANVV